MGAKHNVLIPLFPISEWQGPVQEKAAVHF